MDIPYLIDILQKKISILNNAKAQAFSVGDLNGINAVDQELLGVQNTLAQLNLLAAVNTAAQASNTTPTDVLTNAIASTQSTIQGPSASAIINGYDLSAYATDALYEQKIQNILNSMPVLTDAASVDTYIQNTVAGSPLTGDMIVRSATSFSVDIQLLVAIMQNDSSFGTQGVGARTNNPGNVGNTGSAERMYPSWQDGVDAVASWLTMHRVTAAPLVTTPAQPVVTPPMKTTTTPAQPTATTDTTTTSTTTATSDTTSTTPAASTNTADTTNTTPTTQATNPDTTSTTTATPDTTTSTTTATPDTTTSTGSGDTTSTTASSQ